jgi:hypothetical protein
VALAYLGEGLDIFCDALVGVVNLRVGGLNPVVGHLGVILPGELCRHPLAPTERKARSLEAEEDGQRRRNGQTNAKR